MIPFRGRIHSVIHMMKFKRLVIIDRNLLIIQQANTEYHRIPHSNISKTMKYEPHPFLRRRFFFFQDSRRCFRGQHLNGFIMKVGDTLHCVKCYSIKEYANVCVNFQKVSFLSVHQSLKTLFTT